MIEFYIDGSGFCRARAQPGLAELADYLESDIQEVPAHVERVLKGISDVKNSRTERIEESGNAYLLTLTKTAASLVTNLEDGADPLVIGLEEFEAAVRGWLECIRSNVS